MKGNESDEEMPPHPLEGCDPDECYKTMMNERTELIKARREAEDNLVKSIVQISAALVALIAGYLTQSTSRVHPDLYVWLIASIAFLIIALSTGLAEQWFASRAYLDQQHLVEKYYSRLIHKFDEPNANVWVRRCQGLAFGSFTLSLILLGLFAVLQAKVTDHGRTSSSSSSAATTSSSSAATSSSSSAATSSTAATPSVPAGNFSR